MSAAVGIKTEEREEKDKVQALYGAVEELLSEPMDLSRLKVEDITRRAGIGKGTAYEYFSSKEDIIISAILQKSRKMSLEIQEEMDKYTSFKEKVYGGFHRLEMHRQKSVGFLRILHILLANDSLGIQLRERVRQEKCIFYLISDLVEQGLEEGVLKKDIPLSYMTVILSSKALIYLAYLSNPEIMCDCSDRQIEDLIYRGIIKELGN